MTDNKTNKDIIQYSGMYDSINQSLALLRDSVSKIVKEQIQFQNQIKEIASSLNEAMKPIMSKYEEMAKSISNAMKPIKAIGILADNQYIQWNKLSDNFVEMIINSEDVNSALENYYITTDYEEVYDIAEKCKEKLLATKKKVFLQSIDAYKNGSYELAAVGLSSVVDGIMSEVSGDISSSINRKIKPITEKLENKTDNLSDDEIAIFALLYTYSKSIELFSKNTPFSQDEPNTISRHFIVHGRSTKDRTNLDCIKIIRFVYATILIDDLSK